MCQDTEELLCLIYDTRIIHSNGIIPESTKVESLLCDSREHE